MDFFIFCNSVKCQIQIAHLNVIRNKNNRQIRQKIRFDVFNLRYNVDIIKLAYYGYRDTESSAFASDEAQIFSQACARACLIDSQIETANRTEPLSTYNRNNFFFIIPIGQI